MSEAISIDELNQIKGNYSRLVEQNKDLQTENSICKKMVDLVFDRWNCKQCNRTCFRKEQEPTCREINFKNFEEKAKAELGVKA